MRVGLVLEQFDPCRGGLEQWTARFAARLAEKGHEVHIVAGRFHAQTRDMPFIAHPLPGPYRRLAFAEAVRAKLLSLPLDVVHDMGAGWFCDVFHAHGGSWASVTERKLLLQPEWLRPLKRRVDQFLPRHRAFRRLMTRQYADNGQLLIALSQTVADDFQHFHGVSPKRIRIVYNGVDTEHFSPRHRGELRPAVRKALGIDDESVLMLIVAHNFRLKGVPALLRAMQRLRRARAAVNLMVLGGKHLRPWQRMARRLGVDAAVHFVGPQSDARAYYAAADAYVHPTFYDTCSLVVLEAAASGLPIITTRINGVAELLHHGADALLLANPADDEELAQAMQTLLDQSLRETMGRTARQMALRHTFERNVGEVLAVYEEAIGLREERSRGIRLRPPARPAAIHSASGARS